MASVYTIFKASLAGTTGSSVVGTTPDTPNGGDVFGDGSALGDGILVFAAGGGARSSGSGTNWSATYPLTGLSGANGIYTFAFKNAGTAAAATFYLRSDASGFGNDLVAVTANYFSQSVDLLVLSGASVAVNSSFPATLTANTTYTLVVTLAATTASATLDGAPVFGPVTIPASTNSRMFVRQQAGSVGDVTFLSASLTVPGPDSATVTGPTAITDGFASSDYTITLSSPVPAGGAGIVFTPTTTVFSATPTPSTRTIPSGSSSGTFTETASTAAGPGVVSATAAAANITGLAITGQSGVTASPSGSTVTSVTLAPTSATVDGGATQAFTATVNGTGSPSQSVTWGTTIGTVVAGLFTAPASTSSVQNGTVSAVSVQDTSKVGTATVTVPATVVPTTIVWQTGIRSGFAPGLVGGTDAGFGYKVGLDGGDFGPLITAGIGEDSPGSYVALPEVPSGSIPRFRWLDGSGGDATDLNPISRGGGGGGVVAFPSTFPDGSIRRATFADDVKFDGTIRAASGSPAVLHFDAADLNANARATGVANEYVYVDEGAGRGQSIPVALISGPSGSKDGVIQSGYTLLVALDTTSKYHWTGIPAVVSGTGGGGGDAWVTTEGIFEPGETGAQTMRLLRSALNGKADYVTVPGYAVFYRKDGVTEAFRLALPSNAGRPPAVGGGGL